MVCSSEKCRECEDHNVPQCYVICVFPILFVSANLLQQTKFTVIYLFDDYCFRMTPGSLLHMYRYFRGTYSLCLQQVNKINTHNHPTLCQILDDSSTIYITTIKIQISLMIFAAHYTITRVRF